MKRALITIAATLALAAPAQAEVFGLKGADVTFTAKDGSPEMQAGSHPFAFTTKFAVNTEQDEELNEKVPAGMARNVKITFPAGLTGSPTATPRCEGVDFATLHSKAGLPLPNCSNSSVVGFVAVEAATATGVLVFTSAPLYNLIPPPGVAAKFGFIPVGSAPVTVEAEIEEEPPYNLVARPTNITQTVRFFEAQTTIWGNPSDPAHDEERGECGAFFEEKNPPNFGKIGGLCPTSNPNRPFLTLPRSCSGPLPTLFEAQSWTGEISAPQTAITHDDSEPPLPLGIGGCAKLGFAPTVSTQPTAHSAESPTGLDVAVSVDDEGLTNPAGNANSDLKRAEVTLPEGMTLNPSQAEGLGACSEADFSREHADSAFGAGCPASSKVGTVEVETPLLEGTIFKGSLFVAKPFQNPFHSLIALYMTIKEPALGVGIKLAGKVTPDPKTGQLIGTFGEPGHELPQLPFSHFRLHFREGARSPLITPQTCGTYTSVARFTPWADPASPLIAKSSFQITSGVGGGRCPTGTQPFEPGFSAGTQNNDAGSYSPFLTRLTRRDGDQDLTKFSATLPLGLIAKLAGVSRCSDAQLAIAKAKSGLDELANPSCPSGSKVGALKAGAGVGSELTYVNGSVYLAGPYNGAPLSLVEIVPAVAGPFDVGTVVVRQALVINPRTAEVKVDGDRSDPIPHILAGIPLRVRDIQVSVNRPNFTLNPTSCDPTQIAAKMWGGGANPFSSLDDSPVSRVVRFQAANCQNLGFKPSLFLRLKGGTARGQHPALRAVLKPRPGDANLKSTVVRLPRSAFLEQAHIRTICTRVQFAANDCPSAAIYGHVKVLTPLLSEPVQGPVYLRSSNHNLPDLVFDLHGLVDLEAVGRIDSKHGGIRASFTQTPDAPITKAIVQMQGGKKGLIVNSTNLCTHTHRVRATLGAYNGKSLTLTPPLRPAGCSGR
jgi:hypothetical protein